MNSYASVNRTRSVDLTPWCRTALGNPNPDLPAGYRIMGDARRSTGPYRVRLFRHNVLVVEHWASRPDMARTYFDALVDLAWVDSRGVTVTTDAEGWITSIEEGKA